MGEYVVMLLVSAAVTYLLTPLVRRFAVRAGAIVPKRDRDVHAEPIPRMGGIAMYVGIAAGLLVASHSSLREIMPGTGLPGGLLAAGGLIVLIGIIDDRWGINAIAKLAGQVSAAGILVGSGVELQNFPLPSNNLLSLTPNESIVLTILVVVATINAINFIDGLDGLAAGIVCIAAISFFIYYYSLTRVVGGVSAEAVSALAAVVLAGACLGFLPHNFYPARIFMGDTGSMLLGLVLAYVPIAAISSLDYTSLQNKANRFPEILPLLLPAAVLVIPYSDMVRAVVRRTRAGLSPFAPDRKHLHHRLLDIGHSHRSSVLILYSWAALFAIAVVGLSIVTVKLVVLAGTTIVAVLVLALLSIPKLRWWSRPAVTESDGTGLPAAGSGGPAAGPGLAAAAPNLAGTVPNLAGTASDLTGTTPDRADSGPIPEPEKTAAKIAGSPGTYLS